MAAVVKTCVYSKGQAIGYLIEVQEKLITEYGRKREIEIVRTFEFWELAGNKDVAAFRSGLSIRLRQSKRWKRRTAQCKIQGGRDQIHKFSNISLAYISREKLAVISKNGKIPGEILSLHGARTGSISSRSAERKQPKSNSLEDIASEIR